MDKPKPPPVISYATPRPRTGRGELGTLPAMACLIVGLLGVVLLLIGGLAIIGILDSLNNARTIELIAVEVAIVGLCTGAGAFWGAMCISRAYRR
jgi:hypothetical protein